MSGKLVLAATLAIVVIGMLGVTAEVHKVGEGGKTNAIPDEYRISSVPFVKQEKNWCGPASLTMVLNYWGDPINQSEVGSAVDPEHDGTPPEGLISFLESRGYVVYDFARHSLEYRSSTMDELKIWISHDYPVVVSQWTYFSGKGGHYRVVVGYDAERIYVKDPNSGSIAFGTEYFLELWEMNNEYGLTVIGNTTKDSDGDQLTDSNEVTQNTDPFEGPQPFPTLSVALIVIAAIVVTALVYFTMSRKQLKKSNNSASRVPIQYKYQAR